MRTLIATVALLIASPAPAPSDSPARTESVQPAPAHILYLRGPYSESVTAVSFARGETRQTFTSDGWYCAAVENTTHHGVLVTCRSSLESGPTRTYLGVTMPVFSRCDEPSYVIFDQTSSIGLREEIISTYEKSSPCSS